MSEPLDDAEDWPVTRFLSLVTKEWVAYGSEGVSLRRSVQEIARQHDARAEVQMQPDSAVLSVFESGRVETITVVSPQQIERLDRLTAMRSVLERAEAATADLGELTDELVALTERPPPYPPWLSGLGIVLFALGFSVSVQATWQQLWVSAVTGVLVAAIALIFGRSARVAPLAPFVSAVAVSVVVLVLYHQLDLEGGALLLMVPALFFYIPGDVLSASMFDLSEGRITAGSTQLVYSLFVILILYLGVVFGAALTSTTGSELFADAAPAEFPDFVLWVGWVVFTVGFSLAFSVERPHVPWVLLVTLITCGSQQAGTTVFGEVIGTYLAAVVMIVVAIWISRDPTRPPCVVLALCGFFVLTVGALGLEGVTALVSGDPVAGFTDLLKMLTIGAAISIGLLTGSVLTPR